MSALEPGTVIAGRYRLVEKIGHGGMGAVYLVHHVHTDEKLALKILHPQVLRDATAVERFRREARAPARITSEHVARVTDADTAAELDGAPFYVMELLRGRDLERILGEDGPLAPAQVVEYLRQAARALDKAHALGIVHRDLKPENLFLTHREDESPCIKLLDFGIARLGDVEGGAPMVTQVGYVFGTPNYMAPEQTLGDPTKIGPPTDVWAIGLLAFKLLVGEEFFTGKTSAELVVQILSSPIPAPTERGCPHGPAFDAWFARCVARKVEDRFASAGAAIAALAEALGVSIEMRRPSSASFPSLPDFPGAAVPTPSITHPLPTELPAGVPAARPGRSRRVLVIAGGLLALSLGAALLYGATRQPASFGIVAASASPPSASAPASASASAGPLETTPAPEPAPPAASASSTARARAPAAPATPVKQVVTQEEPAALSREQKKRLDALRRLCQQRTYTPAECESKRQAIIRGGH